MANSTDSDRVPKGVPAGGEFVQSAHSEPDVGTMLINREPDENPDARTPVLSAGQVGDHPPSIAARLAQLKHGDPVVLDKDGKRLALTVTDEYRRAEAGFGSVDHGKITVGYGPGRWNTEITAAAISHGFAALDIIDRKKA